MAAAPAAMRLFPPEPTIVAPAVAYMSVRAGLAQLQGEVREVDVTDTDAVLAACEGAHILWLESPTNPLLGIADLPRLCAFARERGILNVVDNTLCTPLLQRPLALGADIVIHSATKAIGGHSDLLLGAVVTADRCRYASNAPSTTRPSWRSDSANTPAVSDVRYPSVNSHPQHARAATMDGPGFMLTFRVRGGAERADAILDSLELLVHATSLGGVETTIERRAKYPAERHIPEDLRMSVGCEHIEDLWNDLQQALDRSSATAPDSRAVDD